MLPFHIIYILFELDMRTNAIKELEKLRKNEQKLLAEAGKSLATALQKLIEEELGGLNPADRAAVLASKEVLAALGSDKSAVAAPVAKAKRGRKPKASKPAATQGDSTTDAPIKAKGKRVRTSKFTDEDVVKFIETQPRTVGDLKKQFGQLIPKRLKQLEEAKKIKCVPEGVKKIYHPLS